MYLQFRPAPIVARACACRKEARQRRTRGKLPSAGVGARALDSTAGESVVARAQRASELPTFTWARIACAGAADCKLRGRATQPKPNGGSRVGRLRVTLGTEVAKTLQIEVAHSQSLQARKGLRNHTGGFGNARWARRRKWKYSVMKAYSLWGSNPRPMAHKTIALTTELRERPMCMAARPTDVSNKKPATLNKLRLPPLQNVWRSEMVWRSGWERTVPTKVCV